jgi:hypothetical protein
MGAEFTVALAGAAAVAAWSEYGGGAAVIDGILRGNRGALYGTLASIFGSLLGFAITAASIVLGFSSSPRLRLIRDSAHYPTLWKVFSGTIKVLGIGTIASLVGLILDRDSAPVVWVTYLVVFVFLLVCLRIARTIWVLEKIIGLLTRAGRQA